MTSAEDPDPRQSALEAAQELREDLETIADSGLPFAEDATQILDALDQGEHKQE